MTYCAWVAADIASPSTKVSLLINGFKTATDDIDQGTHEHESE